MASNWQSQRGQINHNWLQNGVLVALKKAPGLISGKVRTRNLRRSLSDAIRSWEERRREIPGLLGRFEQEMSPRVFFDRVPLCRCKPETKKWLIPLVHSLWLQREDVEAKLRAAEDAYEAAERQYGTVREALEKLPETPDFAELKPFESILRDFTSACETLSRAISAFPHEIKVV